MVNIFNISTNVLPCSALKFTSPFTLMSTVDPADSALGQHNTPLVPVKRQGSGGLSPGRRRARSTCCNLLTALVEWDWVWDQMQRDMALTSLSLASQASACV